MIKLLKQIENKPIIHLFVISILPLILYSKTFSYGFNLDDDYILKLVNENKDGIIGVFNQLYNINDYRPITVLSFYIEHLIFGEINPEISHILNVLYFVLLNISIYFFIQKLPIKHATIMAFIVCLFFIIHPSHAEVVCSLKNRDNLLSMLFLIISLIQVLNYYANRKIKYFILSLFLLGIAILSKRDAYAYLFITVSYYLIFIFRRNDKKQFYPILICLIGFLLVKLITDTLSPRIEDVDIVEQNISFTENPLSIEGSLENRAVMSIKTYWYYIKMMLMPNEHKFYYGYNTITVESIFSINVILLVILYGFVIYLILKNYKKHDLKILLFSLLWFITSLIYCNNFIFPISGIVANRYGFIASLGFIILIIEIIRLLINYFEKKYSKISIEFNRQLIIFGMVLFGILYYIPFTIIRIGDWRDISTLIRADIKNLDNSFEANRIALNNVLYSAINNNLSEQERNELLKESIVYGLTAKQIYNDNLELNEKLAGAYKLNKQYSLSKSLLKNIIQKDKKRYASYELLGDIYFEAESKYDSASYYYNQIIKIQPKYETAYFKYLNSKYKEGKKLEVYHYFDSIQIKNPNNYIATQCLGYYYLFEQDTLKGMHYIKASFEKGFRDVTTAKYVQEQLLKFKDTTAARAMFKYINEEDQNHSY